MLGILRRRKAIQARPEVVAAYRDDRQAVRDYQNVLTHSDSSVSELRPLMRDADEEVELARAEMFRAIDEGDAYRSIVEREPRTATARTFIYMVENELSIQEAS